MTTPAGLGYDLRMAQAARRALLRACTAAQDPLLRLQVIPSQSRVFQPSVLRETCSGKRVPFPPVQVNDDAPGTGVPCRSGILAVQSAFMDGLFSEICPAAEAGNAAVDFPLGLRDVAKESLKDLLRCVRGDSHVGQLPKSSLPALLQ